MTQIVALVQARMGSSRFPGKMLELLGDFPLLEWVLRRSCQSKKVNTVVLATTDQSGDDSLVSLAARLGVPVFRGSEKDVLGRFSEAANQHNADIVVRVCADNPFIDPREIDRLVTYFEEEPCDYACNHQDRLGSDYADGFGAEILSNALLQTITNQVDDPQYREHVTLYLWEHPDQYQLCSVPAPPALAFPDLRFDVDTYIDLNALQVLVDMGIDIGSPAEKIIDIKRNHETYHHGL